MAAGAGQAPPNYAGLSPAAADTLGADKLQPMRSTSMPAPSAFSGASGSQGPAYTYQPPNVANPPAPTAYGAQQTSLGAAPQIGGQSYAAPQLSLPGLVSGAGYSAPYIGGVNSYAAARVGSPIGAQAATYSAPTVGATPGAAASNADPASLLTNLASYQNPYTQQVVNASLADYDQQAGRALAANQANAARNGALGGSRYAIEDAALQGEQQRGRAQLEASLLNEGLNTA